MTARTSDLIGRLRTNRNIVKKILVLGARGNLGQEIVRVYRDAEVVAFDIQDLDITDEAKVLETINKLQPDVVFNCAAYTNVDAAEDNVELAQLINGKAVGFVAKACEQAKAILVHYSTGQIFDGTNSQGNNEGDAPDPINAYGASKLQGEREIAQNTSRFYIFRTCWLYGKPTNGKKSFTDIMIELAKKGQPINAVTDEIGSPTYVVDLAQASRAIVEEQKPFGIYHLTNSGQASRLDWAKAVFETLKLDVVLTPVDSSFFVRKAKRPKFELLSNNKYLKLRPWDEALAEYLKGEKREQGE